MRARALPAFRAFYLDEFNDQPIRPKVYARDVVLDQGLVVEIDRQAEVITDRLRDERLDLWCGYAADAAGLFGLTLHQSPGDVVSVLGRSFTSVGRRHPLTTIIEQPAGQNGLGARALLFIAAYLPI